MIKRLRMWLRALVGWHSVVDGSTCAISRQIFDVHDYPVSKGGDGHPSHFYTYRCSRCGKEFTI